MPDKQSKKSSVPPSGNNPHTNNNANSSPCRTILDFDDEKEDGLLEVSLHRSHAINSDKKLDVEKSPDHPTLRSSMVQCDTHSTDDLPIVVITGDTTSTHHKNDPIHHEALSIPRLSTISHSLGSSGDSLENPRQALSTQQRGAPVIVIPYQNRQLTNQLSSSPQPQPQQSPGTRNEEVHMKSPSLSHHFRVVGGSNQDDDTFSLTNSPLSTNIDIMNQLQHSTSQPTIVFPRGPGKLEDKPHIEEDIASQFSYHTTMHSHIGRSPSMMSRNGENELISSISDHGQIKIDESEFSKNTRTISLLDLNNSNPKRTNNIAQIDTNDSINTDIQENVVEEVIVTRLPTTVLSKLYVPVYLAFTGYFLLFAACDTVSSLSSTIFASSGLMGSALTYIVVILLAFSGPIVVNRVKPLLATASLACFAYTAYIGANFTSATILLGGIISGFGGLVGFCNTCFVLAYCQYIADHDLMKYLRGKKFNKNENTKNDDHTDNSLANEEILEPTFTSQNDVEVYISSIVDKNGRVIRTKLVETNEFLFKRWKLSLDSNIAFTTSLLGMSTNAGSLLGCAVSFCILHYLKPPGETLTAKSPIIRTLFLILLAVSVVGNILFFIAFIICPKWVSETIDTQSRQELNDEEQKSLENNGTNENDNGRKVHNGNSPQHLSIIRYLQLTLRTLWYLATSKPLTLSLFSIFVAYTTVGFICGTFVSRGGVATKLGVEYVILFNAILSGAGCITGLFFAKIFLVNTPVKSRLCLCAGITLNIATLILVLVFPSSKWVSTGMSWGVCAAIGVLAAMGSTITGTGLSTYISFMCYSPQLRYAGFTLVNIVKSFGLFTTFMLAVFTSFKTQLYLLLGAFGISLVLQLTNVVLAWAVDVEEIDAKVLAFHEKHANTKDLDMSNSATIVPDHGHDIDDNGYRCSIMDKSVDKDNASPQEQYNHPQQARVSLYNDYYECYHASQVVEEQHHSRTSQLHDIEMNHHISDNLSHTSATTHSALQRPSYLKKTVLIKDVMPPEIISQPHAGAGCISIGMIPCATADNMTARTSLMSYSHSNDNHNADCLSHRSSTILYFDNSHHHNIRHSIASHSHFNTHTQQTSQ